MTSDPALSKQALIRSALDAKLQAIGGYDQILWKIRAGYLAILYGGLALLLGSKDADALARWTTSRDLRIAVIVLVCAFSIAACTVDVSYLCKKLKVIAARDALMKCVLNSMRDGTTIPAQDLAFLLRISGEADKEQFEGTTELRDALIEYERQKRWNLRFVHALLYGAAPAAALVLQVALPAKP